MTLTEDQIADRLRRCLRSLTAPAQATGEADMVLETAAWLRWLPPDDAELVRSRAEGARWKSICWRFGITRATAHRRWRRALAVVASSLTTESS